MRISVNTADLDRLIRSWSDLPAKLHRELRSAAFDSGRMLTEGAKSQLGASWLAKNSARYQAWKARHGFDTRPMLRTHLMKRSVSWKRFPGKRFGGQVGFRRGLRYPSSLGSGLKQRRRSIAMVGRWLEDGSGNYPARPVWERTADEQRRLVVERYAEAIRKVLII